MIERILTPQLIDALGWTLLHSLWQGGVFAILLVLLLIAMKRYTAQARYVVSVSMLSAFFVIVAITFYNQWCVAELIPSDTIVQEVSSVSAELPSPIMKTEGLDTNTEVIPVQSGGQDWIGTFRDYYKEHLPLLVTFWLLGVLFLQLRFLGQLAYVQRLRHYGTELIPAAWSNKFEELEGKLRIQKKVKYLTSIRIASPMVIGWLKPTVLFPKDLFHSLSESEIYTVIAHELAHIRREDFVVNLIQNFLCNVFFFHPGVWWMSNRIDEEREHCCDDLAMTATGTAVSYARTLINISQYNLTGQTEAQQLAVAFAGKRKKKSGFTARIKRLFITPRGGDAFREGFTSALILFAALSVAVMAIGQNDELDQPAIDETVQQVEEVKDELETAQLSSIVQNGLELPVEKPSKPINPEEPINPSSTDQTIQTKYVHDARLDALIKACNEGKLEIVRSLIEEGIEFDNIGTEGFTPLMAAVNNNHDEIVEYLIKQGADVNEFSNGWSALIEAADEGALESMKLLLDAGADIDYYRSPMSPTAASMAASNDHLDCLKVLYKYGADINGEGRSAPPLHMAAEEGNIEVIEYLIRQEVDINKLNILGQTALMYAASEGQLEVAERLVAAGADVSILDRRGVSAMDYAEEEENVLNYLQSLDRSFGEGLSDIHRATLDGKIEKVAKMVENGTDVNSRDVLGRTPLHIASREGHNIDMQVLLDIGADINAKDNEGRTPMMYAIESGSANAIILLVQKNANIHIQNEDGSFQEWDRSRGEEGLKEFIDEVLDEQQDVHEVQETLQDEIQEEIKEKELQKWNEKRMKEMLKNETFHVNPGGTHLQQYNIKNGPPDLMSFVSIGLAPACKKALNSGVSANVSDDTGQTALMVAAHNNYLDIAAMLIEHGADVSQSSYSGLTALHYAALENHAEMTELLIKHKANIDAKMNYSSTDGTFEDDPLVWEYIGATPLFIATENESKDVLTLLLAAGANRHHNLTKVTYKYNLNADKTYLSGGEVVGLDQEFLKQVEVQETDDFWTPYKQAVHLNKSEILVLFNQ